MNPDMLRDLLARQQTLERRGVRYRQGTVTAIAPLTVALGASSTAYVSVQALESYQPTVGDVVAALTFGNDLLVLGKVATGTGGITAIATTESRTNTAYGTLTTPDQVAGVVLPANGLLQIGYQATWQESVNNAARAALFIGANQLKVATDRTNAAPIAQETALAAGAGAIDKPLASYVGGLNGVAGDATVYTGNVTTGQVLGVGVGATTGNASTLGVCTIFAAAGTYTISVQFKSTSGSVTAKNRVLWVRRWI